MKSLLSLTVCFVLLFVGCQEVVLDTGKIDYSRMTVVELSDALYDDQVFVALHNQSNSEFSKMATMIESEKNSDQTKSLSKKEIFDQLGLNEGYWENIEKDIVDKARYINDKFMLDERSEEEVKRLFEFLYNRRFSQEFLFDLHSDSETSCQLKFKEDIAEAHSLYDFSFALKCPVIANGEGSGNYPACSSNSAYNTVVAIVNAIDDYNAEMSVTGN